MMRMPLTMWAMFLVAILGLLAFPALTAACLMLLFDRHFGTSFFLPSGIVLSGQRRSSPPNGAHFTRAARRSSGSTCSGSSAIPRSTS